MRAHAAAPLLLLLLGCSLAQPSRALSGWVNLTLTVWNGMALTGDSSTFRVTSHFNGTPAVFTIPDLAPLRYQHYAVPGQAPIRPSLGDTIRSMELNVTCQDVQDGSCDQIASIVDVRLYVWPFSKADGGRYLDYNNITNCSLDQSGDPVPVDNCTKSWDDLPGMDRVASAIAFLFNYSDYLPGSGTPNTAPSTDSPAPEVSPNVGPSPRPASPTHGVYPGGPSPSPRSVPAYPPAYGTSPKRSPSRSPSPSGTPSSSPSPSTSSSPLPASPPRSPSPSTASLSPSSPSPSSPSPSSSPSTPQPTPISDPAVTQPPSALPPPPPPHPSRSPSPVHSPSPVPARSPRSPSPRFRDIAPPPPPNPPFPPMRKSRA